MRSELGRDAGRSATQESDIEDLGSDGPVVPSFQELGTVKLPQGRSVAFSNGLQHKFEVPLLNDPSCQGSIQVLQIHLVDPHYVVSSTRYVPSQTVKSWWKASRMSHLQQKYNLPPEISSHIVEFFIGPTRIFAGRSWSERLRIWHPLYRQDRKIWQEAPIRRSAALRLRRKAISKHRRVMAAVNGPRLYRPRPVELYLRHLGRISGIRDRRCSKDVLARPIPPPLPTATGPWNEDPTNAGEGSSRVQEALAEDSGEETDYDDETEESDSENNDSEYVASEYGEGDQMEAEDEDETGAGGDNDAQGLSDDNAAGGGTEQEAIDVESASDEEFHDAVFYYFDGELEELERQDALVALDAEAAQAGEEGHLREVFYDAPMAPYREGEDETQ